MSALLTPEPLTREAFAPFGDVIELDGAEHYPINEGTTERYHDLARIDVAETGGEPLISIFRAQPRPRPIRLTVMERHPLASQAFYPLQDRSWLVVVSSAGDLLAVDGLRVFQVSGRQGVNYARGVWHHPLLVFDANSDFLIVDRGGPGDNLDEVRFTSDVHIQDPA